MQKNKVPNEWDLGANRRYKRQNMERAMRGKIERGIVELVTNSDDSYRDLEDNGKQVSGKIQIEIERKKKGQPSTVILRDRAGGMNRLEMYNKLGELGRRTSGFEKGKIRRGLHGRGARDIAAFGVVHFESIKDEEYNHLIIPPSLKCQFKETRSEKANKEIRDKLGVPRGNGTVVTIEVESRFAVPLHENLRDILSRYYSLRDLFSNPKRKVTLVDLNKNREDPLSYKYHTGEKIFDDDITISGYSEAKAHLIIRKHTAPFNQGTLPWREGILVKSAATIHDCTYFDLESEPFAWRFTGELYCEFIDKLVREYDDREEINPDDPKHPSNNPTRLLDPFRDGLIREHPFAQKLYKKCKELFQPFIEELKAAEEHFDRKVTDEYLDKKLDGLSKEISKIFEKKLSELDEEIPTEDVDDPRMKKLPIGLHIIPPGDEQSIIAAQPKTFSVIVKHYEALDESLPVNIISSDPDNVHAHTSPVFLKKFTEDRKVGSTTFTVEGSNIGTEAYIEISYNGYNNLILVKVVKAPSSPEIIDGLSFEKPIYHIKINKEKNLSLLLKTTAKFDEQIYAEISSDHPEIVVKGGGRCQLRETDTRGVFSGNCRIMGRQLKAKGIISARFKKFSAHTQVVVEEREQPTSGVNLRFEPVEDDFRPVRYKWDNKNPYLMLIGAKHPSVRKYLGEPTEQGYPGLASPLYHAVLAEVIAEALTFRILETLFIKEGEDRKLDYHSTDLYYHRHFSDFLAITHKHLGAV